MPYSVTEGLKEILRKNFVSDQDISVVDQNVNNVDVRIRVEWTFGCEIETQQHSRIKNRQHLHFDRDSKAFNRALDESKQAAKKDVAARAHYLNNLYAEKEGVFSKLNEPQVVRGYPALSVGHRCKGCAGSGVNDCIGCFGTGKLDCLLCSYGRRSDGTYCTCLSGKVQCPTCAGYRQFKCGTCNGDGEGTEIAQVVLRARPKIKLFVRDDAVLEAYLHGEIRWEDVPVRLAFVSHLKTVDAATGAFILDYRFNARLVDASIKVRQKSYRLHALSYGNFWLPIQDIFIFDELLDESARELVQLQEKIDNGSARRDEDKEAFRKIYELPLLKSILASIKHRSSMGSEVTEHLLKRCNPLISKDFAKGFGAFVDSTADFFSPQKLPQRFKRIMWWIYAPLVLWAAFIVEQEFGPKYVFRVSHFIYKELPGMAIVVLAPTLVLTAIFALCVATPYCNRICRDFQKNSPEELHRKPQNIKLVGRSMRSAIKLSLLFMVLSFIVGKAFDMTPITSILDFFST